MVTQFLKGIRTISVLPWMLTDEKEQIGTVTFPHKDVFKAVWLTFLWESVFRQEWSQLWGSQQMSAARKVGEWESVACFFSPGEMSLWIGATWKPEYTVLKLSKVMKSQQEAEAESQAMWTRLRRQWENRITIWWGPRCLELSPCLPDSVFMVKQLFSDSC